MKKEPALIQSLQKASMDKGRSRFFLVFLLLSFFFWFIAKFSKTYTEVIAFQLSFRNTPVAIVPQIGPPLEVETTLSATGFQFLYYRFIDKELAVDLGEASFEGGKASVQLAAQFQAIYVNNTKIQSSFTTKVNIAQLGEDLVLETNQVGMEVSVDRFSEESFRLPVALKNAPFNQVFKFFPAQLLITFSAPLQDLKNITPEDFSIGVDYTNLNAQENRATLKVFQAPEGVQNLRWEPKTVEYLIRQ